MWQVTPKVLEEYMLNWTYCTRMALFLFSFVQPAADVSFYNKLWVSPEVKNNLAFEWKKRE